MSLQPPKSLDEAYEQRAIAQGLEFTPVFGEPPPLKDNPRPDVWGLVIQDMVDRNEFGKKKYGIGLKGFNGRDPLKDAYEEALDLCVYLKQAIYERGIQ